MGGIEHVVGTCVEAPIISQPNVTLEVQHLVAKGGVEPTLPTPTIQIPPLIVLHSM